MYGQAGQAPVNTGFYKNKPGLVEAIPAVKIRPLQFATGKKSPGRTSLSNNQNKYNEDNLWAIAFAGARALFLADKY